MYYIRNLFVVMRCVICDKLLYVCCFVCCVIAVLLCFAVFDVAYVGMRVP